VAQQKCLWFHFSLDAALSKSVFSNMLYNRHWGTQKHTDSKQELLSVLVSYQSSWESPETDLPLLPTPGRRETLSLCSHTKDAVSVCRVKCHGLTRDYLQPTTTPWFIAPFHSQRMLSFSHHCSNTDHTELLQGENHRMPKIHCKGECSLALALHTGTTINTQW